MNSVSSVPILESFERLEVVQTALEVLRQSTGLSTAVVAHVTETTWTACAVLGPTSFGLKPGDTLPLQTTFCDTVRGVGTPLRINHAANDPRFAAHPARSLYNVESYIAVPIHRRDGEFFGVLCALDAEPAQLTDKAFAIFHLLAHLIAFELEAAEREKQQNSVLQVLEDFISIAAHDLRQPLTTVLGRAQLLARQIQRELPSSPLLASVNTLVAQARRAILMSGTVLDIARLEAGTFTLDRAECDLVAVAHELLDDIRTTASEYDLILRAPPALLMAIDKNRILQVLRNLLDNAVKYTPAAAGPILLELEARESEVAIRVVDSGQGVPPEELPQLFARGYRASTALGQGTSGAGLGLYIVRKIVEAHGGTIRATLAARGGLMITLSLPHAQA
jgi:signal transduction histidine kinase